MLVIFLYISKNTSKTCSCCCCCSPQIHVHLYIPCIPFVGHCFGANIICLLKMSKAVSTCEWGTIHWGTNDWPTCRRIFFILKYLNFKLRTDEKSLSRALQLLTYLYEANSQMATKHMCYVPQSIICFFILRNYAFTNI